MVKKILLWSLFILFAGVLVFGAVYRTNAKSEQQAGSTAVEPAAQGSGYRGGAGEKPVTGEAHEPLAQQQPNGRQANNNAATAAQQGQGYGRQADSATGGEQQGQGNGRGANGEGQLANSDAINPASGTGYGQGARQQTDAAPGEPQRRQAEETAVADILTVSGEVAQVPGAGIDLILATSDGEMTIGTGPDYLAGQGFVLTAGETIEVTGFWEDGEFKAVEITRTADGTTIALRDAYGRPNWSGAAQNQRGGGGRQ